MSVTAEVVLGIDAGTQGLRVGAFTLDGRPLAYAGREYPTVYPQPGWAEQAPDDLWQALVASVRDCLGRASLQPDQVVGLSVDGTSSTVIAAASDGTPLRPAILWMDSRAFAEAEAVRATGHPCLRYSGGQDSVEWMVPKALWLKRHQPDLWARADRLVEAVDWLAFRLTGRWTASLCNATCKWNYVRPEGGWDEAFLAAAGLEDVRAKWPAEVLALGEPQGRLTTDAAESLGLRPGIAVAQSAIDAHVGMLGLGAVDAGQMAVILGTSVVHLALSDRPVFDPGIWGPYPEAVLPGTWLLEGGQVSAGSILGWLRDRFGAGYVSRAAASGVSPFELMDRDAARVPPGSEGVVVLDHWQGARTPQRDPLSRGVIWGLTLSHGLEHVVRATYEALAFGTRNVLDTFRRGGFSVQEVCACGGGTRSRVWVRLLSDICGVPLRLPEVPETACLGGAVLAAVAAGAYPDVRTAARGMVRFREVVEPNLADAPVYDFYYDKYLRTYELMKDLLHEVGRSRGTAPGNEKGGGQGEPAL